MAVCRATAGIQPYLVTVTEVRSASNSGSNFLSCPPSTPSNRNRQKKIKSSQLPPFGGDGLRNDNIHYPVGKHHGNRNATQRRMLRFGSLSL
ncbi:hypothetical protein CCHR01_10823 [Colletotrichum chrysophilum]|uniref:Uncharacterized protein n=1 Tax=Colletotrichum chrysophilum TaxID=1836956 RepID=A0AAD9EFE1_9PEZI|nr:hypothetical protein CCHR01_10823 [Colletotrichum chrysophilum]